MKRLISALTLACAAAALVAGCDSPGVSPGSLPAPPPGSVSPPVVTPPRPASWDPTPADLARVAALDAQPPLEVARGLAALPTLPASPEAAAAALDARFEIRCETVCRIERKE